MEKKEKLADLLTNFIFATVRGQLSGFYKLYQKKVKDIINPNIIMQVVANYYNVCYKALILKNDEYVTENFNSFTECLNHSEVCLLHILNNLTVLLYEKIDFDKLNYDDYSKYMLNITLLLEIQKQNTVDSIKNIIGHDCKGINIKECDPNIPLFIIKTI
jgi:hypothetical protein